MGSSRTASWRLPADPETHQRQGLGRPFAQRAGNVRPRGSTSPASVPTRCPDSPGSASAGHHGAGLAPRNASDGDQLRRCWPRGSHNPIWVGGWGSAVKRSRSWSRSVRTGHGDEAQGRRRRRGLRAGRELAAGPRARAREPRAGDHQHETCVALRSRSAERTISYLTRTPSAAANCTPSRQGGSCSASGPS